MANPSEPHPGNDSPALSNGEDGLHATELPPTLREEIGDVEPQTALIMIRLARLSRQVQDVYQVALRSVGMSYSEYAVLHTLVQTGPPHRLSPTRINDRIGLSSGGMTKTVDRLESAGLVRRTPDPADGRGVLVELTDAGRTKASWIFRAGLGQYVNLLGDKSPAERSQLAESLRVLMDALEGLSPVTPADIPPQS